MDSTCFFDIPSATSATLAFVRFFEELQDARPKMNARRQMTNVECRMPNERSPNDGMCRGCSATSFVVISMSSPFVIRASSFLSSVAFAHDEVQTAEDSNDVADGG